MKKILFILFIFFSLNSYSQTYFPFPDSAGIWRQASISGAGDPWNPTTTPYSLFINGDTTINSNIYNKLYRSLSTYNIDTSTSFYIGALREVNRKIYFHPDSTAANNIFLNLYFCNNVSHPNYTSYNSELLLYDFDV
ncbi:MAG: hypothetical protein P8Q14_04960, partial [Vicingaceae bacterium]|nr:hypothetical protein [Vicingaceae bacterium]